MRQFESRPGNTGDNTTPPAQENAGSFQEPAIEPERQSPLIRSILLAGLAILVCMATLKWADVVEWVDGEWRLRPKREAERDKQMRKVDVAEQYALIANSSGYYECLHCPSNRMFLKSNEIWKYGVTNQGEKQRYTTQFFRHRQLRYLVQFTGTYSQCLVEEKRKLYEYPILPENLARPDSLKLVLPPGNLQMR